MTASRARFPDTFLRILGAGGKQPGKSAAPRPPLGALAWGKRKFRVTHCHGGALSLHRARHTRDLWCSGHCLAGRLNGDLALASIASSQKASQVQGRGPASSQVQGRGPPCLPPTPAAFPQRLGLFRQRALFSGAAARGRRPRAAFPLLKLPHVSVPAQGGRRGFVLFAFLFKLLNF